MSPSDTRSSSAGTATTHGRPSSLATIEVCDRTLPCCTAIADAAGVSLTHLALAWNVEHPAVTAALLGPRTEGQLDDLLGAAQLRLDPDTLDAVDEVVPPGTTINAADRGWTPPGLTGARRRRPR